MKSQLHTLKKILISSLLLFASLSFAQYDSANNNYGNSNDSYNNYYYGDDYDYPDDYYYDYPTDYYPQSYYESYYNDYRNSIVSINWSQFFRKYRLSRYQIEQIIYLNQLYPTFSAWDSYYGSNPDRWYYERFYALQNILGPRIFVVFQNNYYRGYNPVVYFQNYRRIYYVPRFHVQRQYRNVNIIKYRVDRDTYKNRRANNGLYDPNYRSNGLRNNSLEKSKASVRENNGFRAGSRNENQSTRNIEPRQNIENNGFRSGASSQNNRSPQNSEPKSENRNNDGFRNDTSGNRMPPQRSQPRVESRENSGFRSGNSGSRTAQKSATREVSARSNTSTRGGGFR